MYTFVMFFFVALCVLLELVNLCSAVKSPSLGPQLPLSGGLTKREISIDTSDYPPSWIDIPIDHFSNSTNQTFRNRYWINGRHYNAGGPVFFFDSGEQNAHPLVPYFLAEAAGPSAVMALARRFNGLAIIFEHRFYGDLDEGSYPFPMNSTTGRPIAGREGYDAYQYLTFEQALEDTIFFAENFQPSGLEKYWSLLKPKYTPWIWLGGSYPGIRGATMRVRNPETFFATWASSAPVEARVDMWTYYAAAERSMTRNCSADWTAVTKYVDGVLSNGTDSEISDLKYDIYTAVLSGPKGRSPTSVSRTGSDALSGSDVGNSLLLPLSFYQYYGFEASVQPFCDIMETMNRTSARTLDNGGTAPAIASESGINVSHNITAALHAFLVGIAEIDYDEVPYSDDPIQDSSWQWQYCSEFGYYQRGNPENPHTIQSKFMSLELFQGGCNESFPIGLPSTPDVSKPLKYGGWHMQPSNIMWTSGEFDPWRTLSPASIDTSIGAPNRQTVQTIPECNEAPSGTDIFGLVYRDMVHVSDMRALLNASDPNHQNFSTVGFSSPISTEPLFSGVGLFSMALEKWLPCFGNSSYELKEFGSQFKMLD